ncbi:MAG: hypothetical protein IKE70_05700, partial [Bacilli bacterium]|nr:hypothetical protein [Bacilli bacterium]
MDKKIVRFFPLFLVICFILDIVITNMSVDSKGIWIYIMEFLSFVDLYAISTTIFYIDYKKNGSIFSIIGLIGIVLYFLTTIASILFVKNINITDISSLSNIMDKAGTIGTITIILSQAISCLKYLSIISLISINLNNSITDLTRKGAI